MLGSRRSSGRKLGADKPAVVVEVENDAVVRASFTERRDRR